VLGDLRVGVCARVGRGDGMVRVLHVDPVVNLSRVLVRRSEPLKLRDRNERNAGEPSCRA
jgi:hypothetical protein